MDRAPSISSVDLGRLSLASPVLTASGTFGHGDEVARLGRSGAARRGHGEVGEPGAVGGEARAATAHDRVGDGERGRPPGSGHGRVARATISPRCAPPARA